MKSSITILFSSILLAIPAPSIWAAGEEHFKSSDAAISALKDAVKVHDTNRLHAIFGPAGRELASPDRVEATNEFAIFAQRVADKVELVSESGSTHRLVIGADRWPFPIPLVNRDSEWYFDTAAGREEILNRRIGANELKTIDVLHTYVAAQREYATRDRDGDQVLEFAEHLRSTRGTHDGLYWPLDSSEDVSPLGPLIAEARSEGYKNGNKIMSDPQIPYHGYYFKILTRQGPHVPGGKYNYLINGHMIGGFALVAWPAQWGNSGVMTFVVNQQDKVYQRNLGAKSAAIARAMTTYDPDGSWTLVNED